MACLPVSDVWLAPIAERGDGSSGQNLTLESRRSGGDAIDRTSGSGPEVNCENGP